MTPPPRLLDAFDATLPDSLELLLGVFDDDLLDLLHLN